MDLFVIGIGSGCVIADGRLDVWNGTGFGNLHRARLFACRSAAQAELERIETSREQPTMKTYVNRIGPEDFDRYVIVNEDHEVFDGEGFGDLRSGLVYANRDLAKQDAARIEAERSNFFQGE
jgi:hypothetical protein